MKDKIGPKNKSSVKIKAIYLHNIQHFQRETQGQITPCYLHSNQLTEYFVNQTQKIIIIKLKLNILIK
jgi:hypothetical protein